VSFGWTRLISASHPKTMKIKKREERKPIGGVMKGEEPWKLCMFRGGKGLAQTLQAHEKEIDILTDSLKKGEPAARHGKDSEPIKGDEAEQRGGRWRVERGQWCLGGETLRLPLKTNYY